MPIGEELPLEAVVYRRIPANQEGWVRDDRTVDYFAFRPTKHDKDGLSFSVNCTAAEAAATGRAGAKFYVASLLVRDMNKKGIKLFQDGERHALLREWTAENRKSDEVTEGAIYLSTICSLAEGPFDGQR